MRLILSDIRAELDRAIVDIRRPIAAAATGAVTEAAEISKQRGRASIGSQGFSSKWQDALRADVYPRGGTSMSPAALVYHKIPYAGVFENPSAIAGKMMWLPLPTVPVGPGGKRLPPSKLGVPLVTIKRSSGPPLLGARIRANQQRKTRLSLSQIRRGKSGGGTMQLVPLYVGVSAVSLRKRFGIAAIVRAAASQLGALYVKHFKP